MVDIAPVDSTSQSPQRRINRRTFAVEIGELLVVLIAFAVAAITAHREGVMLGEHAVWGGIPGAVGAGVWTIRWAIVARLRDLDRPAHWSTLPLAAWFVGGIAVWVAARGPYEADGSLVLPLSWTWIAPAALLAASIIALLLWPGTGDNRYAPKPQPRLEWMPWRINRATYAVESFLMLSLAYLLTILAYLWVGRGDESLAIHICLVVLNLTVATRVLVPRLRDAEPQRGAFIAAIALTAAAEALRVWAVSEGEWRALALVVGLWAAALAPPALLPSAGPNEYGPAPRKGVEWGKLFFWFSPWPQSAIRQRLRRRNEPLAHSAGASGKTPAMSPPGRRL